MAGLFFAFYLHVEYFVVYCAMKVNGIHITEIFDIDNILVEQTEQGLVYSKTTPVFLEFNYKFLIGMATLTTRGGKIYADLKLIGKNYKGYFPAIGFSNDINYVYCIGLSSNPNIDPQIMPL